MDYDAMRDREGKARAAKMYDSPSMRKQCEAEKGPKKTPEALLAVAQVNEAAEHGARLRARSDRLTAKHNGEQRKYLISSTPVPESLKWAQKKERDDLTAKNEAETVEMKRQHLRARDALRSKSV